MRIIFGFCCLVLSVWALEDVNKGSKLVGADTYQVHRSLVLNKMEEKPRQQIRQRPGAGVVINTNRVPDIVCYYARYGRWPAFPQYLRPSVRWLSQLIFNMNDNAIRSFCRQFNYFIGPTRRLPFPTRRNPNRRRTTRTRFRTRTRSRTTTRRRRRTTTTASLDYSTNDFSTSIPNFDSSSINPSGGESTINPSGQGGSGTSGQSSGSANANFVALLKSEEKPRKLKYYGIDILKPIPFYP